MIKVTLVRYGAGKGRTRTELKTESFRTGQEAMTKACEWLHDVKLRQPGTTLYAYPGVRPDDGQGIDQDWDAIASPTQDYSLRECLAYAPELDRLEREYGDPREWHRWMADRRGLTHEEYYERFGVWPGPGRPPLQAVERSNDDE